MGISCGWRPPCTVKQFLYGEVVEPRTAVRGRGEGVVMSFGLVRSLTREAAPGGVVLHLFGDSLRLQRTSVVR